MFVCGGCEHQWPDDQLKYTAIHHARLNHPAAPMFLRRFHSRGCLEAFLQRLRRHADAYLLTDVTGPEPVQYGPARPGELLAELAGLRPAGVRG